MKYDLNEILSHFTVDNSIEPYGDGHINDTYVTAKGRYILQRINNNVFKKPDEVMENIVAVTEHIRKKLIANGEDADRGTLTVIKTKDGKNMYETPEGDFFRVYKFIDDTITYQSIEKPQDFYHAAKAFGKFQKMLSDFPADKLHETIKNFHYTPSRYDDLMNSAKSNKSGRAGEVQAELDFVTERKAYCSVVTDAMDAELVPVRVTHNDTKLNNVLLDAKTGEGVAVIDLDTVMPGSLLYDYGDSMRFGTNTAAEDEADLTKVTCDLNLFEAYTKGFVEEMGDNMTAKEIELLPMSAILLTFECGMRFLADHIDGDTYFKIHREGHNLDRARNQFKLVYDMEQKLDEMKAIVAKYVK